MDEKVWETSRKIAFSECNQTMKTFSVVWLCCENYIGKLFLAFGLGCKKSIFKKCKPKPTTTTVDKHNSPTPTQYPNREKGKNCYHYSVAITTHWKPTTTHQNATTHTTQKPPKHHHPHHHHNNKIRDQRKWKLDTKPNWGLVQVREKKWDEREKKLDQWHAMSDLALIGWRERERR